MADNDIATRAPESDAQEKPEDPAVQSVFPGDTIAQEGPSMGVSRLTLPMLPMITRGVQ